jgi:hypothetical protein
VGPPLGCSPRECDIDAAMKSDIPTVDTGGHQIRFPSFPLVSNRDPPSTRCRETEQVLCEFAVGPPTECSEPSLTNCRLCGGNTAQTHSDGGHDCCGRQGADHALNLSVNVKSETPRSSAVA